MIGLKFRGRPPIRIAESVKDVVNLKNSYAECISDRSQWIDGSFVGAILGQSVMSWEGRNPRPALDEDGNIQDTDLDLFSFLVPIAARNAVIEIPQYTNRRKVIMKSNERKIGSNQFGPIVGLISHKDVFSFSVRIHDKTIIVKNPRTEKEDIGAYRNYMFVDCSGRWYPGWNRIRWDPTLEENAFLRENSLLTGNVIYFKYSVHPNRWQSVFSAHYLLKKMLLARFNDEADFYRAEIKRLKNRGIKLPPGTKPLHTPPIYYEGPTKPIKVVAMEMVLDIPDFKGSYPSVADTQQGLIAAYRRENYLTYTLKPIVQFFVRSNELAYFLYGGNFTHRGKVAHWMEDRQWKSGYRIPRGKVDWNIMVLAPDVALRYRVKEITQRVSSE